MKFERNKTGRPCPPPDFSGPEVLNEGVISAHHGVAVEVLFDDGERRMARVKRNSGHVVGDEVVVTGETLRRLPRRTELRRRDARGGIHLVAANLDVLGIVVAPLSEPGFIDRAVVAARSAGMKPFVVVNKCDLEGADALCAGLAGTYRGSVQLFQLSAATRSGLDQLERFLGEGHRGAFVGVSGVGKSSLLNALCPDIDLRVGALREYKSLGQHTTTVSTLHSLPGGGELVDTPGFRDFGVVDSSPEELALHFPGFEQQGDSSCRFRNCRHRSEPGCAISALVEHGHLSRERYSVYLDILAEVEAGQAQTRGVRGSKG